MPTELGDFHQPDALLERHNFEDKLPQAVKAVKDGLPSKDACILVFGISKWAFNKWVMWYKEDIEAGFDETESNLIKLMNALAREDVSLHRRFAKNAIKLAVEEDNVDMLKFMLKTRWGYSEKTKSEVEISTEEETSFNINIIESKPREE